MSVTLRARLVASQTATPRQISIVRAIEDARSNLLRIESHIIHRENPPGEFTRRKIASVASRLLQAAMAEGMGDAS